MSGAQRMCPNAECDRHGQPTTLLGGCDCGAALVPHRTGPTDEQLARLASAFSLTTPEVPNVSVEDALRMFAASPALRDAWLVRHAEVQAALSKGRP